MFLTVFKHITRSWYRSYCFHRRSHDCGIREAASWAWWNAWNPTDGARYWRNSYLSLDCVEENARRDKERRDSFSKIVSKEAQLKRKWKDFYGFTVEAHLERAKADNKKRKKRKK